MSVMKSFVCAIVLWALVCPAAGAADLTGKYTISKGVNPVNEMGDGGEEYGGEVIIKRRKDDIYELRWSSGYQGIGMLSGHSLDVGWSTGPGYSIAVYTVRGGRLIGGWVADNTHVLEGVEELEGSPELRGSFAIVRGGWPDTWDSYSGTVEITKSGEVFNFRWRVNDDETLGVGLLQDNELAAAGGQPIGVTHYQVKGDQLIGRTAIAGARKAGTEILTRQ